MSCTICNKAIHECDYCKIVLGIGGGGGIVTGGHEDPTSLVRRMIELIQELGDLDHDILIGIGQRLNAVGDYPNAVSVGTYLEKDAAVEDYPTLAESLRIQATAYQHLGQNEQAVEALGRLGNVIASEAEALHIQ